MDTNTTTTNSAPVIAPFDPTKTYAAGDKFTITFDGKTITVAFVRPGVVQKTASIFYIRDVQTGEWLYCFPARLERLIAKGTDLANYKGRDTKAIERKAAKAVKAEAAQKLKAEREAAAKAALEKISTAQPAAPVVPEKPAEQATAPAPEQSAAPAEPEKPAEQPAPVAPQASAQPTRKAAKR